MLYFVHTVSAYAWLAPLKPLGNRFFFPALLFKTCSLMILFIYVICFIFAGPLMILFIYVICFIFAGPLLLLRLFSSCSERGYPLVAECGLLVVVASLVP